MKGAQALSFSEGAEVIGQLPTCLSFFSPPFQRLKTSSFVAQCPGLEGVRARPDPEDLNHTRQMPLDLHVPSLEMLDNPCKMWTDWPILWGRSIEKGKAAMQRRQVS